MPYPARLAVVFDLPPPIKALLGHDDDGVLVKSHLIVARGAELLGGDELVVLFQPRGLDLLVLVVGRVEVGRRHPTRLEPAFSTDEPPAILGLFDHLKPGEWERYRENLSHVAFKERKKREKERMEAARKRVRKSRTNSVPAVKEISPLFCFL